MKIIQTPNAPAAIGPYSQAIAVGSLLFTSGQLPLRADGTLVEGGIEAQTEQVLNNLRALVEAAGTSLGKVIKTTVFLKDFEDFAAMNNIYAAAFNGHCPARSTVQISRLAKDVLVEIEAIISLS
jgi:2-iminobutanoate/2-iminopropanoate deaminase